MADADELQGMLSSIDERLQPASSPPTPGKEIEGTSVHIQSPDETKDLQEMKAGLDADISLQDNPGALEDLHQMARFFGHGSTAGLIADTLGMPVATLNMAGEFVRAHPIAAQTIGNVLPVARVVGGAAAAATSKGAIETGSPTDIRKKLGSYATTPEEEGVHSWLAEKGYDIGEFVGAALPFGAKGAVQKTGEALLESPSVRKAAGKGLSILNDLVIQPGAVGFAASEGKELGKAAGYPEEGEDIGVLLGAARSKGLTSLFSKSKQAYSWLHDALGFGTGAEGKVRRKITSLLGDNPQDAIRRGDAAPSDVYLPNDIKLRHDGLIALRREVMKNDRELAGAYDQAESALENSIRVEGKYSKTNFARVEDWLGSVQHEREVLTNLRMLQAIDKAEQTVAAALPEATSKGVESQEYQAARSQAIRHELGQARDDSWAVTQSEWDAVDKNKTVDPHGLYDTIETLEEENRQRPRPDKSRFPSNIIDKFFKPAEEGSNEERQPLYGTGTRLGHLIDASSDVEYAIRVESDTTKGPPDPVRLSYLRRLAEAINKVKFGAEGAETDPNLKRAIEATKFHHETFTHGLVGEVLGHTEGGTPVVPPSNVIRHFLAKGPAGIDSYKALQKALAQRTGESGKVANIGGQQVQLGTQKAGMQPKELLESYLKQDFHDNAFPNDIYNPARARQWLANHAGPMLSHPEVREELQAVIDSQGRKTVGKTQYKKSVTELEKSAAHSFLNNEPGKMFNSVMQSPNQYQTAKELIEMTMRDPTGRATRGFAQMALDRMFMDSTIFDAASQRMERLSGKKMLAWIEDNQGLIKALEETRRPSRRRALPGIADRFSAIAKKAEYLELFQIKPDIPKDADTKQLMMPLTHLLAAIGGADIGAKLGRHAASLQTAHIGSAFLRNLAEKLTPDKARQLLRQAFLDENFFKALNTPMTGQNAAKQMKTFQPYLYSVGAPVLAHEDERQQLLSQAKQAPDGNYYVPDPNRAGKYLRVDHGG
jgi:hypothetical protein